MKASDNVFPKLIASEGAAPATPSAGTVVMYAKTDGLLYSKDDAGAETALGGGAGAVASVNGATGVVVLDGGDIGITDTGGYFTATDVEGALQELGAGGGGAVSSVNGATGAVVGVTAGKHAIPIMAGAITPSTTGGCAALATIASAASQPDIQSLDFDTTTQEYAQFAIPMPKSWNEGTVTAQFRWSHAATTTNFGVVWNIQAVAVSDDDTIEVNFGTAQQIADTGGTTNDLYITSETPAITVAGTPATADTVYFRISRVTGDGSDTMAIDARLHSVVLFITTDADTDA